MKGKRGLTCSLAALAVLLASVVIVAPWDLARAATFNPTVDVTLSDDTTGANADVTYDFNVPGGDANYEVNIAFTPPEFDLGADIPLGAYVADLDALATLGLINGSCTIPMEVSFAMLNASVDTSDTVTYDDSYIDWDGNTLPDGVDKYPDFLNTLFPGLTPTVRMFSVTSVAGTGTMMNMVVFEPGTMLYGIEFDAALGRPSVQVLADPTRPPRPVPITDLCTPLGAAITTFGVSKTDPEVTPVEGGDVVSTNPTTAGDYTFTTYTTSLGDADGDGLDNSVDACPYEVDTGQDDDHDGIDNACDPTPDQDTNSSDHDDDGYLNRADNCPLDANTDNDDADGDDIGDVCDDHPNDADAEGEPIEVYLEDTVTIVSGAPPDETPTPTATPMPPAPGQMHNCPEAGKWSIATWSGQHAVPISEALASCSQQVDVAYRINLETQAWTRYFQGRPEISNLTALDDCQGVIALGSGVSAASAATDEALRAAASGMLGCPLQGKWAISVWTGADGTDAEQAFATCGEGAVAIAYGIDPQTQAWSRWFAGQPEVSNLTALNDMQGVMAFGGAGAPASRTVPMFRGDPAHTGVNPGPGVEQSPKLLWGFETGGMVISSPAVVDGVVYIASYPNYVYALDAARGEEHWRFETDGEIESSPAVVDGVVYVGSADGYVYALDAATGEERWDFKTGGEIYSSPAVVDGVVYIGSYDRYVYALDAATGDQRWRFKTVAKVFSSPAVVDGVVYVGSADGYAYALDAATGEERWEFETDDEVWSSPAVVDGVVYIGSNDRRVYALDAATGEERWRFRTGGEIISSPAVVDGVVYIGSNDTYVYALDAATGEERWDFKTGGEVMSSPVVVYGVVYIGSNDGYAYALDAATGEERWDFQGEWLWASVVSSPAVVDGVVYIGNAMGMFGGYVYAISADGTGAPAAGPLKIGVLVPYTGVLSDFGVAFDRAAKLAVKEINEAGGVLGQDVVLVLGDSGTEPIKAQEEARRLIDIENVSALIGAAASGVTLPVAAAVAVPSEIVQISPASTSPALTAVDDNDYLFRTTISDAAQGLVLAHLADDLGFTSACTMYVNNAYGQGISELFADTFEDLGGTVTAQVSHATEEQVSYLLELNWCVEGGPDVLLALSYPEHGRVYLKEALEHELIDTFLFVDGTKSDTMFEALGWNDFEGMYGTAPGALETAVGTAFDNAYEAEYGEKPPLPFMRESYDAVYVIALAAAKANSTDSTAIRDALRDIANPPGQVVNPGVEAFESALTLIAAGTDIDYQGAAGPIDFDPNGDVLKSAIEIWQISGGDIVEAVRTFAVDLSTTPPTVTEVTQ